MRKGLTILTMICLVLALNVFAAEEKEINEMEIGDQAFDFNLPGVDGEMHSLEDYSKADLLVIIFTCNHCPTAQAYEERMMQMVEDYKDNGVAFVAISPNDPKAVRLDELGYTDVGDSLLDMKLRAKEKNFNFPYLFDGETQEVSRKYGPTATPHAFVFDNERKLRYTGGIDDNENPKKVEKPHLRNAINALLAGKPVPEEKTRRFGCSIKWSDKRHLVKQAEERWAEEEVELMPITAPEIETLLKNDSDKLRLVNFWATWCPPCVAEFPDLVDTYRMYRHRQFELITISANDFDDKDKVLTFLKKYEASNTNYIMNDDSDDIFDAIGHGWNGGLPFSLLIKPGGEVVFQETGMVDSLELRRAIVKVIGRTYFEKWEN